MRHRGERGAAIVDFVLVLLVLIPIVLGIIQVALVMHVRNTLAAAASEGARLAATSDRGASAGTALAAEQVQRAGTERFIRDITVHRNGQVVVVTVRARVPALGLAGPGVDLTVAGRAIVEPR